MKVLVDTDPGIDDAVALGMLLSRKDIDIVGITCVNGNTSVDNTVQNTLKILEAFDRKDIPVFRGAETSIINCSLDAHYVHGGDGMANCFHYQPDTSPLQEEVAALAINRLAHKYSGELTILALGPLTNLLLALRLNSSLSSDVKEVLIMGGNYKGVGNISIAAEFNFFIDPVAAHAVLEEFQCPKYLLTWELTKEAFLSKDDIKQYCNRDTKKSKFMKSMFESEVTRRLTDGDSGFCDSVAAAVTTNREIIRKKHEVYATVELHGMHTKGTVVIDWHPEWRQIGEQKVPNVIIVDEIDATLYKTLFLESTI